MVIDFGLTDEQESLLGAVRRLLSDHLTPERLRASEGSRAGYDEELWRAVCAMGLPGVAADPHYGGGGGDIASVGVCAAQLGRSAVWSPLVSSVTAIEALSRSPGATDFTLDEIVDGSHLVAVFVDRHGVIEFDVQHNRIYAEEPILVPFCHLTPQVLVIGRSGVLAVQNDPALSARVNTLDGGPYGSLEFRSAQVTKIGEAKAAVRAMTVHDSLLAREIAGGARGALELALGYVSTREQFGKPIGSFQVLQHRLADLATSCDGAELLASEACWLVDHVGTPEEAVSVTSAALRFAVGAYSAIARQAVQMAGGYGYMTEYDMQIYFRRAKMQEALIREESHGVAVPLGDSESPTLREVI